MFPAKSSKFCSDKVSFYILDHCALVCSMCLTSHAFNVFSVSCNVCCAHMCSMCLISLAKLWWYSECGVLMTITVGGIITSRIVISAGLQGVNT